MHGREKTLFLLFSPKCIPLAELLYFSIHLKHKTALKLGVHQNLLATKPTLIIPKGAHASKRTTLIGKSTIIGFFSRLATGGGEGIEPESITDVFKKQKEYEFIERVRTTPIKDKDLVEFLKAMKASLSTVGECLGVDWLARSLFQQGNDGKEWWEKAAVLPGLGSQNSVLSHLDDCKQMIRDTMQEIPCFAVFKFNVVQQVMDATGLSLDKVTFAMINSSGQCGVSLNVHKLGIANIVDQVTTKFKKNDYITDIVVHGPFINFLFAKALLYRRIVSQALFRDSMYGNNSSGFGKFALVEFSSPNIAKPFHAGHLRSTIIGSFLKKCLEANGWDTLSVNYLGDWGKQYGLLAVGYEKYGKEEELKNDPIKHLFDVYVAINRDAEANEEIHDQARLYFKRMEDGDEEALKNWNRFRDLSIDAYKKIYSRINVEFDLYSGESQYSLEQMKSVLEKLKSQGLLTTLEGGALAVDLKDVDLGTAIIGKTDGTMLYLSRDIAAAAHRKIEFDFDEMFYVVGSQQLHHFKQLFTILERQGNLWARNCHHIDFGMIKSKDGSMSTRKGKVVFLQQILDHVQEEMHEVMKKNEKKYSQIEDPDRISDVVGISAIMIQDMGARRHKDYAFDWSRMLSFEGDTGPYLQYAHARLCSIERQTTYKSSPATNEKYCHLLTEEHAMEVIDLIGQFPEVVAETCKNYEPNALVKYALKLSHAVSSAYTDVWVHGQPEDIATARLGMYRAARVSLGNALRLLGLQPVERM